MSRLVPISSAKNRLLIIVATVLIAVCSLGANLYQWTFTSDDVAQQTITYNLLQPGAHSILLENDTYVSKLPVYLVFSRILRPGRLQLLLESALFSVCMLILLFLWWKKSTSSTISDWLLWLWLLATGLFWMSLTTNPNTRNLDLGLMLLYVASVFKTLKSPVKHRSRRVRIGLMYSVLGGLLTYDDPYFLFFVVLPLFATVLIYYFLRKQYKYLLAAAAVLVAGLGVYIGYGAILSHLGLSISSKNELSTLSATITAPSALIARIWQVGVAYLSLLGANPATTHWDFFDLARTAVNEAVIALGLAGLVTIIRKRRFSLLNLWILITFITVFVCLSVTGVLIYESARYLIILLPLTALLAATTVEQVRKSRPKVYPWFIVLVATAVLLNVAQALIHTYQDRRNPPQNQISYQIASAMQKNHVGTVYALYWQANITYYLSDYRADVLPAICSQGHYFQDPTLLDAKRFTLKTSRIGFIVSPQFRLPTENSLVTAQQGPFAPSCTVKTSIAQFGKPQRIVQVNATTDLLIYPHGLNKNDEANHRRSR